MPLKLTERQLALLAGAVRDRITELNEIIEPLLAELTEHENFLKEYEILQINSPSPANSVLSFELLPWSKKITSVLEDANHAMTANEIVTEITNRVPGLAEEASTRSSVASLLSRRSGKLFKKIGDKYGLIHWRNTKFN